MSHPPDPVAIALAYHKQTKHHPHRYARSAGYLDWDSQPDPFRTYAGAPRVDLPLAADKLDSTYRELFVPGAIAAKPLELESLGAFFELALGLTAWKEIEDSRWALRSDPSSGNLHPTEGYAVLPEIPGCPAGVFHYVSRDHCLERRCHAEGDAANALRELLPPGGFLVGLSSIHWRESWKYGERAFRYCQHDLGHVLGTVRFAAAALGWSAWLLDGAGDARVASVLGLDRTSDFTSIEAEDREHPDALMLVAPDGASPTEMEDRLEQLTALLASAPWTGRPNELSPEHVDWEVIEIAADATRKEPSRSHFPVPNCTLPRLATTDARAATLIRQRRSAVALDGKTSITAQQFYAMLDALVPRPGVAPWDALPWEPRIHLGIFVHRVEGLERGLYLFERAPHVHELFEPMIGERALWTKPADCPEHLSLYCIGEVDVRGTSSSVSCQQEIAGAGAFSLGMLAEYRETIDSEAANYRRLFWEAGLLGQVLYLEAEAAGVRGTGIGCYFDDSAHQVFGLEGDRFQSLYHFTLGTAVEDGRLVTHPPYAHLNR